MRTLQPRALGIAWAKSKCKFRMNSESGRMQIDVIVNGDDLGASSEINRAIFDLMAQNKLTSASVLANGACVEAAIERTRYFPRCSFGVHLNVTEFEPTPCDRGVTGSPG